MADGREHTNESADERLDRNWNELLQELRVAQTGVQILTGFLLTIPFTPVFDDLARGRHIFYVCILGSAVVATALLVSPVAFHRILFRHGQRDWLVRASAIAASSGLAALGITMVGVVWFLFDVVIGDMTATIAAIVAAILFLTLWVAVPIAAHKR